MGLLKKKKVYAFLAFILISFYVAFFLNYFRVGKAIPETKIAIVILFSSSIIIFLLIVITLLLKEIANKVK